MLQVKNGRKEPKKQYEEKLQKKPRSTQDYCDMMMINVHGLLWPLLQNFDIVI